MTKPLPLLLSLFVTLFLSTLGFAETTLHNLFSEHSVLQHGQVIQIWGTDRPKETVTVRFSGQKVRTRADQSGEWLVTLQPLEISRTPQTLTVSGSSQITRKDILVGDVWLCSGQSNMEWKMRQFVDHDVELLTADIPTLRLMTITTPGSQEPLTKIPDQWAVSKKETALHFSAVGFHFGKFLTDVVDLPIGLICNAWGGSAAEAWVSAPTLAALPGSQAYRAEWEQIAKEYPAAKARFEKALAKWEEEKKEAARLGQPFERKRPGDPTGRMRGAHRPSNLWNGRLMPIHRYGIKGVLWYQGETNAAGYTQEDRAYTYRELFPALVEDWRNIWGEPQAKEDSLPFYWVNLASHRVKPPFDLKSEWATLRESQSASLSLKNTGEVLAIDLGEAEDIHPNDKRTVATRLARLALKNQYGFKDLAAHSPRYLKFYPHETKAETIVVMFKNTVEGLKTKGRRQVQGFYFLDEANKVHKAEAQIVGKDRIAVTASPLASMDRLYYSWSDYPDGNVFSKEGLPLAPFRISLRQ